ncbi:hypothetical protein GQ53DRAFT_889593 [Thozetella sp. PMI_491]|nr:hypothetical protein GQ53DRAFT_889593 [Thozetella sp. PMI_491]
MGPSSLEANHGVDLVFKVERIRIIPQAPIYTTQLGKPTPCVWLPRHAEAKLLLGVFITELAYIQHTTHLPSLPATVDDVYRRIDAHEPIKAGSLVLLLSIIANATHVWGIHDDAGDDDSLFLSSTEANVQTSFWIKATLTVLHAAQNTDRLSLETIQGVIILSFVICNLEGVSMQYRSLISTGLLLGRELGLHRIDHESNRAFASTLQAEVGRRVWWYLVATDWLLAVRYGGPAEGVYQANPHHMLVNKPRNINDEDLLDTGVQLAWPASQATDMSYFLQRIRLAEISRSIADHSLVATTSYAHVVAMDSELDQMIHTIPTFFQLDSYRGSPSSGRASRVFIQAYMLNLLVQTQRCRLHLPYLASNPSNIPTYVSSQSICLMAAQEIIRIEKRLLQSEHPFIRVRLRLPAILHSVFMATTVLLVSSCARHSTPPQDKADGCDVTEGLRIIKDARNNSLAAAKLYESLKQILAKHRVMSQQTQHLTTQGSMLWQQGITESSVANDIRKSVNLASESLAVVSDLPFVACDQEREDSPRPFQNLLFAPDSQTPFSLDDSLDFSSLGDVQWDSLVSGIVSSSFF